MTPEEMAFWEEILRDICISWCIGAAFIGLGINGISIENVVEKAEEK